MHTLHRLIQRLADAGIEFVIVGGYAGVLHGSAYVTDNLDICVESSVLTVERIRRALADIHPIHRDGSQKRSFLDHSRSLESASSVSLDTDEGILDVLTSVHGVGDFARLRRDALCVELFGRKCWLLALEDLILAKEASDRERDQLLVKELRYIAALIRAQHSILAG